MLIICEGPDKCGKSTFVEESADGEVYEAYDLYKSDHVNITHLTILDYWYARATIEVMSISKDTVLRLHLGPEDTTPYITMMKCIEISKQCTVILDRSFISELVYGPIYRNKLRITEYEIERLIDELSKIPHRILFFQRDYIELEEYDPHDEYENDQEKAQLVRQAYNILLSMLQGSTNLRLYKMSWELYRNTNGFNLDKFIDSIYNLRDYNNKKKESL